MARLAVAPSLGAVLPPGVRVTAYDGSEAGAPGADANALQKKADAALTDFPTAETQTIDTFKKDQLKQVDQLVGLIYALLSLSVIVALLVWLIVADVVELLT